MDQNFSVIREDATALVLRYRPSARVLTWALSWLFAGIIMWAGLTGQLNHPFNQSPAREIALSVTVVLWMFGLHALLNEKRICIDCGRGRVEIGGKILGVWGHHYIIPFRQITGVRLVYHAERMDSQPYWKICLEGSGAFKGKCLDASGDANYVNHVGEKIARLIGCPLTQAEFATREKQISRR